MRRSVVFGGTIGKREDIREEKHTARSKVNREEKLSSPNGAQNKT